MDRIARECGLAPVALPPVLDRLAAFLSSWNVALPSGDLYWELLSKGQQKRPNDESADGVADPERQP
ncbi:hypothetical protein ACF07B_34130 [Streptomyces sp. NPDC015532]|uniref:hypothetical protein n=1 Tax=Streptomyces sp. NPDC015532 TaxID=3364960 RepID=UPI0036FA8C23